MPRLLAASLLLLPSEQAGAQPDFKKGPPMGQVRQVVAKYDKNGDGRLDNAERKAAREGMKMEGGGGFGFGFGKVKGGFFGKGREPGKPGPKVEVADVKPAPAKAPLYDPATLRTLFLTFENKDWEDELADFYHTDVEVPATLVVDGKTYKDVGVRFRGMSSYFTIAVGSKRSFNLSMDFVDKKQRLLGRTPLVVAAGVPPACPPGDPTLYPTRGRGDEAGRQAGRPPPREEGPRPRKHVPLPAPPPPRAAASSDRHGRLPRMVARPACNARGPALAGPSSPRGGDTRVARTTSNRCTGPVSPSPVNHACPSVPGRLTLAPMAMNSPGLIGTSTPNAEYSSVGGLCSSASRSGPSAERSTPARLRASPCRACGTKRNVNSPSSPTDGTTSKTHSTSASTTRVGPPECSVNAHSARRGPVGTVTASPGGVRCRRGCGQLRFDDNRAWRRGGSEPPSRHTRRPLSPNAGNCSTPMNSSSPASHNPSHRKASPRGCSIRAESTYTNSAPGFSGATAGGVGMGALCRTSGRQPARSRSVTAAAARASWVAIEAPWIGRGSDGRDTRRPARRQGQTAGRPVRILTATADAAG